MKSTENPAEWRLLGVDVGTKRLGLAIWNPQAQMASPLSHRARKSLKEDLQFLKNLVTQNEVQAFVVGVPLNLEGKRTMSTENAEFWIDCLKKNFEIPVFSVDEALTTKEAMGLLRQTGAKHKKDKVDSLAAALILEEFIRRADERRKTPTKTKSSPEEEI